MTVKEPSQIDLVLEKYDGHYGLYDEIGWPTTRGSTEYTRNNLVVSRAYDKTRNATTEYVYTTRSEIARIKTELEATSTSKDSLYAIYCLFGNAKFELLTCHETVLECDVEEARKERVEFVEVDNTSYIERILEICAAAWGHTTNKFCDLKRRLAPYTELGDEEAKIKVTEHINMADYLELMWVGFDSVLTYGKANQTELISYLLPMLSNSLGNCLGGSAGSFGMSLAGCSFVGESMDGSLTSWARSVALGGIGTKIMSLFEKKNAWDSKSTSTRAPFLCIR